MPTRWRTRATAGRSCACRHGTYSSGWRFRRSNGQACGSSSSDRSGRRVGRVGAEQRDAVRQHGCGRRVREQRRRPCEVGDDPGQYAARPMGPEGQGRPRRRPVGDLPARKRLLYEQRPVRDREHDLEPCGLRRPRLGALRHADARPPDAAVVRLSRSAQHGLPRDELVRVPPRQHRRSRRDRQRAVQQLGQVPLTDLRGLRPRRRWRSATRRTSRPASRSASR